MESARIVGALARYTGDFPLAEDIAQEALAEALVSWSVDGVPAQPAGWLLTVGRRRAIDTFRRRAALGTRFAVLARDLDTEEPGRGHPVRPRCHRRRRARADVHLMSSRAVQGSADRADAAGRRRADQRRDRQGVPGAGADDPGSDHPRQEDAGRRAGAVRRARSARTRRAARLGAAGRLPDLHARARSHPGGVEWMRADLAGEARRLARVLVRLAPEPEAFGLLALLELTAARFPARVDASGRPVLLEDQDRRLWDQTAIRRGRAALAQRVSGRTRAGRIRPAGRHRRVPRGGTHRSPTPIGSGSSSCTRPSAGWLRRRSSNSTARSRSRWPPVRRTVWRLSTPSRLGASWPAHTCFPRSAVSCSPDSAGVRKPGRCSGRPPSCAVTPPSARCSNARWMNSADRPRPAGHPALRCPTREPVPVPGDQCVDPSGHPGHWRVVDGPP